MKERARKKLGPLYPTFVRAISPVWGPNFTPEFLQQFDLDTCVVLNLGSGLDHHDPRVINIDLRDYKNVALCADIGALPFPDNSIDGVLAIAVLEHVPRPAAVVAEIFRVLRPHGRFMCFIPFMQGIHAAPSDYQRYTPEGLEELFSRFESREVRVGGGPTSSLVWILQEWLAIALSFGSIHLYWFWYFVGFLLSPLKFLDILLVRHPMARNIASGFTISGTKRGGS